MSAHFFTPSRYMLDPILPRVTPVDNRMDRQIADFIRQGRRDMQLLRRQIEAANSDTLTQATNPENGADDKRGPNTNGDERSAPGAHRNTL